MTEGGDSHTGDPGSRSGGGASRDAGDGTVSPPVRSAIEISIRLGAISLLVVWCLMIIAPFLGIVVWALIIAIASDGGFERLCSGLGGRRVLAACLAVTAVLMLMLMPAVLLSETLVSGAQEFAHELSDGTIHVPPPDSRVAEIPIVGDRLFALWQRASSDLAETLGRLAPQLRAVSSWLLKAAGSAGAGILQLVGSILIAGVMLVRSDTRRAAIERFALRMAGDVRGPELVELANGTVRSVVQGIVGVSMIQGLLAGAGFAVAGIPGAGVWAMLVLVAAVVQIPAFLAMIIPVAMGFSQLAPTAAVGLLVWCLLVGLVDNVLKPLLFGRGVKVPSLVIFMGAIGGMLTMGVIGLFLGAVVLALGFALFMAWLADPEAPGAVSESVSPTV